MICGKVCFSHIIQFSFLLPHVSRIFVHRFFVSKFVEEHGVHSVRVAMINYEKKNINLFFHLMRMRKRENLRFLLVIVLSTSVCEQQLHRSDISKKEVRMLQNTSETHLNRANKWKWLQNEAINILCGQ